MLTGKHVILFSSDDWASGLKTSKYHVAVRMAQKNKVLFVNSVGLRSPQLGSGKDWGRIFKKVFSFLRGVEKINENLFVLTPLIIPYQRYEIVQFVNKFILVLCLKFWQWVLRFDRPILLIFSQNMVGLVGKLNEAAVIYYCIDELTGYQGVDKVRLAAMEKELLVKSDCVIACSQRLTDLKSKENKRTFYVPHGVDWELFKTSLNGLVAVPDDLKKISKPVIGYFGFLSEDWIDYGLLNRIAHVHPEWSIVLIGRSKSDLAKVLTEQNIHYLGMKNFEDLPAYAKGFDAAIIPFNRNELTLSSNPLKLMEYLSSGLPVVSVDIPEVRRFKDYVSIAGDHEDFIRKLELSLDQNGPEVNQRRSVLMKEHSWDRRLADISGIITKILNEKGQIS